MKVHYFNILLFALPLNILEHNKNKPYSKQHTKTNRLLCECDPYRPNYDNDLEMKELMDNFNKQTQQRFHEYDERLQSKRMQCKEKCNKEIHKIILKDKLEKQMTEQFATLDTIITTEDIPTCICEKSMADKVEKGCLRCGGVLGGGIVPAFGTIGGTTLYALNALKPTAIADAIAEAIKLNADRILAAAKIAGAEVGKNSVIAGIIRDFDVSTINGQALGLFFTKKKYTEIPTITEYIYTQYEARCLSNRSPNDILCLYDMITSGSRGKVVDMRTVIQGNLTRIVTKAEKASAKAAKDASETATNAIKAQQTNVINTTYATYQTAITASIIAIVVIVLIMVIIYFILRHRRKKKMKKKLQYIKLLEE
ncbi:rifin PIR protein,putative [Plasmodium sp. DRC-Itaito]|nr:rifin PIR protein,putative [Plasmodium sp. DRC-Itaito]